ncbi:MAG: SMC-Scp complex subunit ScpB, partial [bacterium]|nr:SMC-Scp complex subunit ScpB [bacterium]
MAHDLKKKSQELETLLFIYGEAMPVLKIKKLLGLDSDEFAPVLKNLEEKLADSGLMLVSHNDSFQLTTRPEHASLVSGIVKEELNEELTPPAL